MTVRRPAVWIAVAVAAMLAGCGGGGDADLAVGPPSRAPTASTAPAGTPAPLDTPAQTTAPGARPGPGAPPGATPGAPNNPSGGPSTGPPPGPAPAPSGPGPATPPAPAPGAPAPPSGLAAVEIRLTKVGGFTEPLAMAVRTGDPTLYFAEKRGRVRALRNGSVDGTPVLDISGDVSKGTEQGLLGLAFSPDGGRLYVNYTDKTGDTHIVEYGMAGGQADPATRREVLFVAQPAANHNGGNLVFGPDGRLWIGLGDGGGAGDPQDNAQRLDTLLGKMLRIDPRPDGANPYTVPVDNPFVGTPGAKPEIWAYGLRNPWRYSFDKVTGDLWIGDVGQNAREEIDFQPAGSSGGQNYGWARLEGTRPYSGAAPANAVPPLLDYARSGGNCGVTGGYVYRGTRIPGLVGAYLYGDYCAGQLQAVRQSGGQVIEQRAFPEKVKQLTSFGQDGAGELYVISQDGGVFRIDPA